MSVSVSETIGKLLLEGYKMLADSCDVCCTVLMQDRRGRVICVQCESTSMANAAQPEVRSSSGKLVNGSLNSTTLNHDGGDTVTSLDVLNGSNATPNRNSNTSLSSCEEVLIKEMQNATISLQNLSQQGHDMQGKLIYVRYIRECAETIQALKGIKKT